MIVFAADDNRAGLEEFQTRLKNLGCEVIIADSVDNAIRLIHDESIVFDIAILDMVFPKFPKGGLVLLKEIKQRRSEVECIILTAFTSNYQDAVNCMAMGAFTYIDRTAEVTDIFKLAVQAYALKEGKQHNPTKGSACDIWALCMPPKTNKLVYMKAQLPRYKRNEVILRTLYLGVCGTDVHTFSSGTSSKRPYPLIEFHEAVGEVVAKGADVEDRSFSIGDWAIPMVRRCGKWNPPLNSEWDFHVGYCDFWQYCPKRNQPDVCPYGVYLSRGTGKYHGFGAEFFSDSEDYLIKVTKQQKQKLGLLCVLTEPISIAWKVIREIEARRGIYRLRDRILVAGIGPIGILCITILHKMYPGTEICAIDLFDRHHKVNLINKHFKRYVKYIKVAKGQQWPVNLTCQGFDVIIDATGDIADVFPKMCNIINPEGILALLSVSDEHAATKKVSLRTDIFNKIVKNEVKIIGSVCASKQDMEDSIRFMSEICDSRLLRDLILPKQAISPKDAPASIKRLSVNKDYLKILIQP